MSEAPFHVPLAEADPELHELIEGELARQRVTLDLVASENVPSRAVLEAQGSILTAKYADGYPGEREYDTCEWIDEIERLAIARAKALFCADHANVQAYSGASANMAVLHAVCEPGDPVLGWSFEHGGHPSHYASFTFAGRYFRASAYGVRREDRLVDMDEVAERARADRPKVIIAGWSCYPRFVDFRRFREICDEVGALLLVDMAHFSGLVAAGLYPDPVPYADACTMTTHKTLGGARGGLILCREELGSRIDAAVYPGVQGCPLPHVMAAQAATFLLADTDEYRERMERTVEGARAIAAALDRARVDGRLAATVVTAGTDVHQLLVDLAPSGLASGGVLAQLNALGISANDIRLAFDAQEAPLASGLRFGASALASRGLGVGEFAEVGEILVEALAVAGVGGEGGSGGAGSGGAVAERISALLQQFPIYDWL